MLLLLLLLQLLVLVLLLLLLLRRRVVVVPKHAVAWLRLCELLLRHRLHRLKLLEKSLPALVLQELLVLVRRQRRLHLHALPKGRRVILGWKRVLLRR